MRELQLHVKSLLDLALGSDELRRLCVDERLSERACDEWELCLAEAVTNSLMHGNAAENGGVNITFKVGNDLAEMQLKDSGTPIPEAELDKTVEILNHDTTSGLGMLKLLNDELHYEPGPPNRLVLRRHL